MFCHLSLRKTIISISVLILFSLTACSKAVEVSDSQQPVKTLTVITHDSFSISEDLMTKFEQENNVRVSFLKSGDTGAALNRVILTQMSGTSAGDVFYGVDNTFLSRALENDIFEAYDSPLLGKIPAEFKLDTQLRALPVDYGDVCINYDKSWFALNDLAVPQTLEDLVKPEYAGLLAVENPAVSSPGLSFLLATIVHFGEEGYLEYWRQLVENDVVVVSDWETAYYTNFSASSGRGPQPMVVSYASSPPAELIYAETPLVEAPTASIVGSQACFRQVEFVGILKGTQNRALAEKFVDFMLGRDFQEDLPLQMFVFPVNPEAVLPTEFLEAAQIPTDPATMDPETIGANREKWIQDWTELVIK
jgi:thiamine transport system substrate-binding protein